MHKHSVFLLLGLISGCDGNVPSGQTDTVATTSQAVYEAVVPELRAIVERSWGTPAEGTGAGRIAIVLDQSVTADTSPYQIVGHLDDAWAESVVKRGLVEHLCGSTASEQSCAFGEETMFVQLSPVVFATADSAHVRVIMSRGTFGSIWEVIVVRRAPAPWTVAAKEMRLIT